VKNYSYDQDLENRAFINLLKKITLPILAPGGPPNNVTAEFKDMSQEVLLTWKSSLTDIEGFRVGETNSVKKG